MTRKRFVKLLRALNVNMRELGYRNDKIDRMIRILHSGNGRLHNGYDDSVMSYQDAWEYIRKNAYPIFFIDD